METRLIVPLLAILLAGAAPATSPSLPQTSSTALIDQARARMMANPADALALTQQALATLARTYEQGAGEARATAQWLQGEAYGRLGESARALPALAAARGWAEQNQPVSMLLANILLSEGAAMNDVGRVADSLTTLQRAHDLFVALREPRGRAKALILIALLYNGAFDHAAAFRYFAQAGEAYAGDAGIAVSVDNGRGNALLELGRPADAEAEFAKALVAARTLRSPPTTAQSLGNLAQAELLQGKVSAAEQSIARGLAITERPDAAAIRPQLLGLAASAALQRGDLSRARALVQERFDGVALNRTILADRSAHEAAYRVFTATGDSADALQHLAALKRLDDQATAIARSTSAALAAARFDYANQELRIARLKAADLSRSVAFERATARTQRLVFIGVVGATLLIMLLLGIGLATIRRSRNEVRAANDDLAASNVELGKALRAKTEFLATTSHEIRTPLNGILGMTQVMMADGGLNPVTRDRLDVVHSAGVTMRALVDDILDMAKIETGRMTIEHAPMDLHATVEDAARLWREPAAAKGLALDIAIDTAPRWITGDAARLRQIVFNLLSNAVKFTAAGQVTLALAEEGGRLRLAVTDTGIGIAPDTQHLIFDSFRQADAGTTRQFGGTGLGLSICRSLARAMGGDVTVTSRPGEGSCFTLDLPYVPAAPLKEKAAGGAGLLVVERNPINRAMFRSLFADLPAVTFADAEDVVTQIGQQRPVCILVDAATLGDEAALSALVSAANGAPVALLTPALQEGARAAMFATGVTQVIEKPISKRALVDAIGAMFRMTLRQAA